MGRGSSQSLGWVSETNLQIPGVRDDPYSRDPGKLLPDKIRESERWNRFPLPASFRAGASSRLTNSVQPREKALGQRIAPGLREEGGGPPIQHLLQHLDHHLCTLVLAPNSLRQRGALQVPGGLVGRSQLLRLTLQRGPLEVEGSAW